IPRNPAAAAAATRSANVKRTGAPTPAPASVKWLAIRSSRPSAVGVRRIVSSATGGLLIGEPLQEELPQQRLVDLLRGRGARQLGEKANVARLLVAGQMVAQIGDDLRLAERRPSP